MVYLYPSLNIAINVILSLQTILTFMLCIVLQLFKIIFFATILIVHLMILCPKGLLFMVYNYFFSIQQLLQYFEDLCENFV